MGASILARVVLFLSSYSPLFLILGLRNSFGHEYARLGMYALAALGIVFLFVFLGVMRTQTAQAVKVASATSRDAEAMSYIVTYLLPFLDVSFQNVENAVALGVILLVIAVLYVHSNMLYINPILNIAGYHIFEVQSETGKTSAVITRSGYLRAGREIRAVALGDYILLERKT